MIDELEEGLLNLAAGTHACLLYSTPEEQRGAVGAFLGDGIALGDHCVYVTERFPPSVTAADLGDPRQAAEALVEGSMEIHPAAEVYLPDGRFDPDRMVARLDAMVQALKASDRAILRATGEMTWSLAAAPGSDRLVEYEARLTERYSAEPVLFVCQYDLSRFPRESIRDVLLHHPVVVAGGRVHSNPFSGRPERLPADLSPSEQADWMLERLGTPWTATS